MILYIDCTILSTKLLVPLYHLKTSKKSTHSTALQFLQQNNLHMQQIFWGMNKKRHPSRTDAVFYSCLQIIDMHQARADALRQCLVVRYGNEDHIMSFDFL